MSPVGYHITSGLLRVTALVRRAWAFGLDFFRDPDGSSSMARLGAFLLILGALYAIHLGRDAAVIAALVGGGAVAILSRLRNNDAA